MPLPIFTLAAGVFLSLALDVTPAWAYVDPGSGSILMQVLLGGAAGLVVFGRVAWQRLRRALARSGRDVQEPQPADAASAEHRRV